MNVESAPPLQSVVAEAYTLPTAGPESDGTMEWDETTLIVVHLAGGGEEGLGYTYGDRSIAALIVSVLAPALEETSALDIPGAHQAMLRRVRNIGRPGIASMAIAAVDSGLWDLKAKLLGCSLLDLLGAARQAAPVYGSGGFTSYSVSQLQEQLGDWAGQGFRAVKMKVGRDAAADRARVKAAREAIGEDVELFVDANGAYSRQQALAQAEAFADLGVTWFEEPVSADDLEGLRLIRERAPAGMNIAAGEYGYDGWYFQRLLRAEAVDVLQADATRCAGFTGFLEAAALSRAHHALFSFHCAPALHAAAACAAPAFMTGEYFFDHARIESRFFEGAPPPKHGALEPDRSRPGLGLEFKAADAAEFRVQ